MRKLLFVCTGNSCRSPMAECIMKSKSTDWEVESRGLFAADGSLASENAIRAMKNMGLDLSGFRSKSLRSEDVENADIILVMTNRHLRSVISGNPAHASKVYTLYDFAYGEEKDVQDPFGGDIFTYNKCAKELDGLIDEVIKKLNNLN